MEELVEMMTAEKPSYDSVEFVTDSFFSLFN